MGTVSFKGNETGLSFCLTEVGVTFPVELSSFDLLEKLVLSVLLDPFVVFSLDIGFLVGVWINESCLGENPFQRVSVLPHVLEKLSEVSWSSFLFIDVNVEESSNFKFSGFCTASK